MDYKLEGITTLLEEERERVRSRVWVNMHFEGLFVA